LRVHRANAENRRAFSIIDAGVHGCTSDRGTEAEIDVSTSVLSLQDCPGETGTPQSTTCHRCRRVVRSAARSPSTTGRSASYPHRSRPFDRPSPIVAAAPLDAATAPQQYRSPKKRPPLGAPLTDHLSSIRRSTSSRARVESHGREAAPDLIKS
jgi:hypothetical protein